MRSQIGLGLAAAALLAAAAVAGCGGGGTSSSVSVAPAASPLAGATINPVTANVVNFTGPGTKVTVSVAIPRKKSTASVISQAVYAKQYGPRLNDKNIRTIGNTAPSASMRAAGVRQNLWAQAFQKSHGRSPQYVSPDTYWMEFVISSGSTIAVDEVVYCSVSSNQCTGTFDAPIGTGLTATLFLYDNCGFLLSAGSVANQTITAGAANAISITLNGVVDHFALAANAPLYQGGAAFATTFGMALTAYDADGQAIVLPGVLIDDTFTQIASVNVQATSPPTGLTPVTPVNVTIPGDPSQLNTTPAMFTWDGVGPASWITFNATPVTTGGPLVPTAVTAAACGANCNGIMFGGGSSYVSVGVTGPGMSFAQAGGGLPIQSGATWNLEIGAPPPSPLPVVFPVSVVDNLPYTSVAGTFGVTFTDVGNQCYPNIVNPLPTPIPDLSFSGLPATAQVNLQIVATTNGQCLLEADDANGNSTQLTISVNNPTITIQQKTRK